MKKSSLIYGFSIRCNDN